MVTDEVDLFRLVENVRYLTKRSTMDNQIRDRIFACLDAYDAIIDCDISMAYDMVRDLTIIRALIKKDSEDLDRKFTIFEKKLRKIAETVLPRDEGDEELRTIKQPVITTIFQDNDIRIIDVVSRKSALNRMEDAKELLSMVKEINKLSESPTLPMVLKCDIQSRMNDVINLLKIDGGLALKLRRDVIDSKNALKKGQDGEPELENKLRILKLKLEKCSEELHRKEATLLSLIRQMDESTQDAMELLEDSTHTRDKKGVKWQARPWRAAFDWVTKGITNKVPYNPIGQVSQAQSGPPMIQMPSLQGYTMVPIDQSMCPGSSTPGSYGSIFYQGKYPLPFQQEAVVSQIKKKKEDTGRSDESRPNICVTQVTFADTVGMKSKFRVAMEKVLKDLEEGKRTAFYRGRDECDNILKRLIEDD